MTSQKPRAPLSAGEIERIIELREEGLAERKIALQIGCSEGSVSWALLREGVDLYADRRLPPVPVEPVIARRGDFVVRRFTQGEDARLLELVAEGMNPYRISLELGRRHNSVIGRMRTLARREARDEFQEGVR